MTGSRIPPEFLEKIKNSISIIELVGEHVVLKKSGANHSGLCPFHSERTPSFSVNENKQLYHCYGCKRGGDLFRFVMEIHGMDFREAVEELADRARIPMPNNWGGNSEKGSDTEAQLKRQAAREKLATATKLNRFAAHFYHSQLSQNPQARRYLERRGCTEDLLANFYVGAAPSSWDSLAQKLAASKAPLPLAVELGLIRPSQRSGPKAGSGYFDLFRNRIMFPIVDLRGKVVGFGGRALDDPEAGPKYLNSSDSFLFQKSKLAFGLFQAQKHIRERNEIILVEGYFDVLALHAAGFANTVATCGTALTPEHLQLFRKFADRIILLFDGDKAGIAATERAMQLGLEHGFILHGATMPAGLDPDEILFDQTTGKPAPEGKLRMQTILEAAAPILDTRIDECIHQASQGPEAQTQSIKQISRWLSSFTDPVGKEVRLQDVEKRLGIHRRLLVATSETGTHERPSATGSARPLGPPPARPPLPRPTQTRSASSKRPSRGETLLLTGIAQGGEYGRLFTEARSNLPPGYELADLFEYTPARGFLLQLQKDTGLSANYVSHLPILLQQAQDTQLRSILTAALLQTSEESPSSPGVSSFRSALGRAIGRSWARFSQQIKTQIAEAESSKDAELQAKLMKEYLDVQRKMKEFSSFYEEA